MPEENLLNNENKEIASIKENDASHPQLEEFSDDAVNGEKIPYLAGERASYVAVKGVFFTPRADNAGAFCIIYRGETGKIILRELWAVRSNNMPSLEVSERWEDFIREMNKIGAYDKDSSEKLLPLIVQSLSSNVKEYLFKNIEETEIAQAEIRKTLENSYHYVVEIKIDGELLDEERAERGGVLRNNEESADRPAATDDSASFLDILNFGGIPLICQPVIDPINGCPVSKIKVGDTVHVTIPETNDIAKRIMDIVRLEKLEAAFPVTIVQTLETGHCGIVLKISEEISGILNLPQEVMLKTDATPLMEKKPLTLLKQLLDPANILIAGLFIFIVVLLYLIMQFIH